MLKQLTTAMFGLALALALALGASAQGSARLVSAPNGTLIELDAARLEELFGIEAGRLSGLTVTELPDPGQGVLFCEGVEVAAYDYLPRASLDWLVYLPYGEECSARVGLLPDAGQAAYTVVSLLSTDQPDAAQISLPAALAAWKKAENGYWAHALEPLEVSAPR